MEPVAEIVEAKAETTPAEKIPKKRGPKPKSQATKEAASAVQKESSPTSQPLEQKKTDYPIKSIVCVSLPTRKRFRWTPALVVHPECRRKTKIDIDSGTEILVRLFSNGDFRKVRINLTKSVLVNCLIQLGL